MAKKPNPQNIPDGWYRNIGEGPLSLGLVTFSEGQERFIPAQTRLKFAAAYDNAIKAGWLQGPTEKGAAAPEPAPVPEPEPAPAPEPVADVPTAPEPENEPVSEEPADDDDQPKKRRRRRRKEE